MPLVILLPIPIIPPLFFPCNRVQTAATRLTLTSRATLDRKPLPSHLDATVRRQLTHTRISLSHSHARF